MAKKNKIIKLLSVAAVSLLLASCDDIVNYPSNKGDQLVINGGGISDVYFNDYEAVYDSIVSSNGIYAKQLDNLLYNIAKEELKGDFAVTESDVAELSYKQIMATVQAGSFSTNNIFSEYRYGLSVLSNMYDIFSKNTGKPISETNGYSGVIKPEDRINDQGKIDYTNFAKKYLKYDYSDSIKRNYTPSIYRQLLTAKYIYENTYSSIGNTNARDVVVVKLADTTNYTGSASAFINKFYTDYLSVANATYDIYDLARMYKGIDLSAEEQNWITTNNLHTMQGQIDEDYNNVISNIDNPNSKYEALASDFTNSYAYPASHGKELKDNALKVNDLTLDGLYLKSSGLSNLPSEVKTRTFSTNIPSTLVPSDLNDTGSTTYSNDYFQYLNGNWYVKPAKSEASTSSSSIVNYDSSSSTYYIVQVKEFVTSSSIAKKTSDSAEEQARKMSLAKKVAYEMASSTTYTQDSTVYFLSHNNIVFSDPYFYKYIKDNYPKVFDTEE